MTHTLSKGTSLSPTEESKTANPNPCQREVSVEIPADVVAKEEESVISRFQKHARVPGFRRGKVPAAIIRQRFGEDIKSELVEHLVPRYFRQETEKQHLVPVSQPQVTDLDLGSGKPMRFKASFEVCRKSMSTVTRKFARKRKRFR